MLTPSNIYLTATGLLTLGALIEGGFTAALFTAGGCLLVYAGVAALNADL